jgi:hypothetical protein
LQIDDELEFGRLQYWQVGRLGALEDAADIDADLTVHVRDVGPIDGVTGVGLAGKPLARYGAVGGALASRLADESGRPPK